MGGIALAKSVLTLLVAFSLIGCNYVNPIPQPHMEGVKYKVIKRGVAGSSPGFRLFGIMPLKFPSRQEALANLNIRNEIEPGSPDHLVINASEERRAIWLLLFSFNTLVVTGDLVEVSQKVDS